MELRPPLHLGVVAIEKGAFESPSTQVANFTFFGDKNHSNCLKIDATYLYDNTLLLRQET